MKTIAPHATDLTFNCELLCISLQVLLPYGVHGVRVAAIRHQGVDVAKSVGRGLDHLLLGDLDRFHTQHH